MINLLPQSQKGELRMAETQKKVSIILIFISFAFLIFILMLSCIKTYIAYQTEALQALVLAKEKEFRSSRIDDFKSIITHTNQNIIAVKDIWQDQILFAPILEKLSSLAPANIYFSNFFCKTGSESTQFNVVGFAANRDDLFYFKQDLEKEEYFQNIYFMPSSWVQPRDADFSFSFSITN